MEQQKATEVALGVPGQVGGRATLQSDRGDETQQLFKYQWAIGVVLLSALISAKNEYTCIWCEHHDDFLAEVRGGGYEAIQVKTISGQGAVWKCSESGFIDAVRKFTEHEVQHGTKVQAYIFFSNAKPYVPAKSAKKTQSLASSPMRLCEECCSSGSPEAVSEPYSKSLTALANASGASLALVFSVLKKLKFQQGPPLEGFCEHLVVTVSAIPGCKEFSVKRLEIIRDRLLKRVEDACTLNVSSLEFYASILQSDGRPASTALAKRISAEDAAALVKQHPAEPFLYSSNGYLQLGSAKSQKDVLKRKMKAGQVGEFFNAMWMQAMGAESRLMGKVLLNPEDADRVIGQLESVVLVECLNAEAAAALEVDTRKRGVKIYQTILERTAELARDDPANVEQERPETLRGIAGLLSGSCNFAWGVPLQPDNEDGA